MVRNYVRKTNRQQWDEDAMAMAVQAVLNHEMGAFKASHLFKVPTTTLHRYVKKKKDDADYKINKTQGKFNKVFTPQQEQELVSYLKSMESWFDGLTMKDVRALAYQLAERNSLEHRFFNSNGMAGQDWVKGFLARHPVFDIRKAGSKSNSLDVEAVADFCARHKLTGEKIFNCDGIGMSASPGRQSKMLPLKGERLVGGEMVTAALCMSAAGSFMPPMLVFPCTERNGEYEIGLPSGGWHEPHASGWMTNELFLVWFERFVEFSRARKESPVLLILDGFSIYAKNLRLIEKARESGVALLCLPPQASQPMDVSFLKPLSLYYKDEVRKWLRANPGQVVTLSQVSPIFGAAFSRTATEENAIKGFKETGIWPIDKRMFPGEDLTTTADTDSDTMSNDSKSPVSGSGHSPSTMTESSSEITETNVECKPGCSSWVST